MVEEWKQWPGDSDIYVSSTGVIMSKKRGIWKRLKESKHNRGYSTVGVGGHSNSKLVHRLVAETFLDPPKDGQTQVNHLDGDKSNNNVENLEWCTHSENVRHAFRTGLMKPSPGERVQIVETGEVYESEAECARAIGGSQGNIAECLSGRRHTHRGYHFRRVDDR
jgi:hypothetical protein